MPRKPPNIQILKQDRETPTRWISSRSPPKQTVVRAKMILESEAGKPIKQIAGELQTYPNKIICWRKRYVKSGLRGLQDKTRSGRPEKYTAIIGTVLHQH